MNRLAIFTAAMLAISLLSACRRGTVDSFEECEAALSSFEIAKTTCSDTTSNPDLWFSQSTCDSAAYDGYDNSEFYDCLIDKFEGTDVAVTCETDADGNTSTVRRFEEISQSSEPAGCRELYDSTATAS